MNGAVGSGWGRGWGEGEEKKGTRSQEARSEQARRPRSKGEAKGTCSQNGWVP